MSAHLFLGLASLVICASCVTPLSASLQLSDQPLVLGATPTSARLIFVRPARFAGSAVSAYFVDSASQRVLGKSVDQTVFAVDVAPGSHVVCPVPVFDQALRRMGPQTAPALAMRGPPTHLTVEAGRTYLLWVSVGFGPSIEALPVRPDSAEERRLLAAMQTSRPVELAERLDDLAMDELPQWIQKCHSSVADARLSAGPSDGRRTPTPAPPL